MPKKNEAKPKKIAAPRSGMAGKKVKKIAVKKEMVSVYLQARDI